MKIKVKLQFLLKIGPILLGLVFSLLNIFYYAAETTLGADIVSRVLPAVAHRIGMGYPYVNYWEITPPGHYIVLDIWAQFFGYSTMAIKLLHFFVSLAIVLLIYYVLSKVLTGLYLFFSATLIYFFLFSIRLTTFILPAELLALVFALAGVSSIFYFKNYRKALFLGSFLLFFAGLIKDPFLYSIITIAPYLIYLFILGKRDFLVGLLYASLGISAAILLCVFYLTFIGSLNDYFLVISYKSVAFKAFDFLWLGENIFKYLNFTQKVFYYVQYSILLPILIYFGIKTYAKIKGGSLKFQNKSRRIVVGTLKLGFGRPVLWTLLFFMAGLIVGSTAQKSLGSHYYIVSVIPIVLIPSVFLYFADRSLMELGGRKILRLILIILLILSLAPKKLYFMDYSFQRILELRFIPKLIVWAYQNPDTSVEKKININTKNQDCILDVYGWGVGTTYLYSQRRPCTRFFIANLVSENWQREEYRKSVLLNNPAALIYNPRAGDLDSNKFERTVVNFSKVVSKCYIKDDEFTYLYWPNKAVNSLSICVSDNIE